ncbi:coiled-coil domain-containing protein 186-like isoform X2 [Macrobrachium nipponense]|uniref:coiled-coil domain-containing protein 186-like isoform X2 n=1 Tax=Macrobrachium nipponense TaxID=159736 RepID=UPI0030C86D28
MKLIVYKRIILLKYIELQIERLEKSLAQAQADICNWQAKLQQAEENYMTENIKIRSELTTRLERMTQQYEAANKDKESMVIKYATSEREVIVARKQKEVIEKKLKDMEKEREQLQNKNKMLVSERARLCQTLDTKVQKNNFNQREIERLKEEVSSREVKIKWAQTKLKSEMDAHKETQGKLDRALMKITKHEEELKSIRDEAEKLVRDTKENENSRANVLDMQLKEEKARLIMERKANEDKGSAFHKIQSELETLRTKHSALVDEANSLRSRVTNFEGEQEETEKLFSSLRSEVTSTRQQVADLNLQLSNSSHLQEQLQEERKQLATANQEVERLQSLNNEIEGDLLSCRQKEAELLAFTQKLTDKNVQIQSQFSALQSKAQLLEIEREEVKTELEEVRAQKSKLKSDLTKENQNQNAQVESLRNQLAEKIEETRKLTIKISDLENEIQVLKRKHANSLKDMMREVQKLRRRLEQQDDCSIGGNGSSSGGVLSGRSSQSATPHDSLSQGSRASSNTSLNTIEYQNTNGSNVPSQDTLPPLNDPLITQQVLVERIIKLQKNAAKKAEKIEFLEEHVSQLVAELKKKSRIIHHYIMKEEAGALSNSASDSSKAELIKHGGIMASVYGSSPRDGNMTLDLSLEINRKLQAVLEDTLLKNITLKDNLNTLGDEIAKITRQNQQSDPQK